MTEARVRLDAARVWVMHDPSFANVTFADDADEAEEPSAYVVVSRKLAAVEIDRRLGMDGVYVEIDDQGAAAYRAATGYTLRGRELRIVISPGARDRLGVEGDIRIGLTDAEFDRKKLITALDAIFQTER